MSYDLTEISKPLDTPVRRVRAAVGLAERDGCGVDPWERAGARHLGTGQPKVRDPNDLDRYVYFQRPSTRAKHFDTDGGGLLKWYRTTGALGAARNPKRAQDLLGCDMADPDQKKYANRIAEQLANEDAEADEGIQYGNLTHAIVEAKIKGIDWRPWLEPLTPDEREMFEAVADEFDRALRRYAIEVVAPEVTVVNFGQECAGNLDFYALHNGEIVVADVKTTKTSALPESWLSFGLQTWLYATSEAVYDPRTEQFTRPPEGLSKTRTLIFHCDWRGWFDSGDVGFTVYELDVSSLGGDANALAERIAEMKKTAAEHVKVLEPPDDELLRQLEASVEQAKAERGAPAALPAAAPADTVTFTNAWAATDPAEAAELVKAAFEGSTDIEAEPVQRPEPPRLPRFRPRNGGLEDALDYIRARADELIEFGHGERLMQHWADEGAPGIGPSHPPLDRTQMLIVDAVLREVETDVGRWVSDEEVTVLKKHWALLDPVQQSAFMDHWNQTGWNPSYRLTRARADVFIAWLHELERHHG